MFLCSVNWKLVQQLQAVILFLIEVLLSLNLSRQKVAEEGKKKTPSDCFLAYCQFFLSEEVHPPVGRKRCCMRKAAVGKQTAYSSVLTLHSCTS